MTRKKRNFATEPEASRSRYLLWFGLVLLFSFFVTLVPQFAPEIPIVTNLRWWILGVALTLITVSQLLYERGRRIK